MVLLTQQIVNWDDKKNKKIIKFLDENNEIIGYEFVNLGRVMEMVKDGMDANEAIKKATGTYGRFADAAKYIDPRKE